MFCYIYFIKVKAEVSKCHYNYRYIELMQDIWMTQIASLKQLYLFCVNYVIRQKRNKV